MSTINIRDIESDPAAFLARVEAGETLLVLRGADPVAEVRPVPPPHVGPRPIGLAAGEFVVPDDFDAPLPEEILREFER